MKFDKKTRLLLLGIVLFLIVGIFLWIRLRSRSTYALPTSNTNAAQSDTDFYNAYTACQSTFATTPGVSQNLFGVDTISASGTTVTVKTLVPHGFTTGKNVVVSGVTGASGYNSPVSVSTTLTNSTMTYASSVLTVTTASAHNLYVGALVSLQGTGNQSLDSQATTTSITTGTPPQTISVPGPLATYTVVSVPSSTTYTIAAPTGVTAAPSQFGSTIIASGIPTPLSITVTDQFTFTYTAPTTPSGTVTSEGYVFDPSNTTVMAAYATKDVCLTNAVSTYMSSKCPYTDPTQTPTDAAGQTAYTQYTTDLATINNAYLSVVQNPGGATSDYIKAARKADITIATRKYISTVCPGFYAPQTGTDPGTEEYQRYTIASGSTSGFDPSNVTGANVTTWAQYAAQDPTVTVSNLTSPLKSGSTVWTNANTAGLQNWQVARNAGPGTVPQPTWAT